MTDIEEHVPAETSAVALTISTLSPEALDRYLVGLTAQQVAEFALRTGAIAAIASRARKMAHLRLVETGYTGEVFQDHADGAMYCLTGGRHRRIKNIAGFVEQLASEGIDARPLVPWLSSDAFKVGETIIGDPRIASAVKEFAEWVDDPVSLVELDPRTMKPVRR